MTLSKVPGATLEEIDAAIKKVHATYDRQLNLIHRVQLAGKLAARSTRSTLLKRLRTYRAVIELEANEPEVAE